MEWGGGNKHGAEWDEANENFLTNPGWFSSTFESRQGQILAETEDKIDELSGSSKLYREKNVFWSMNSRN